VVLMTVESVDEFLKRGGIIKICGSDCYSYSFGKRRTRKVKCKKGLIEGCVYLGKKGVCLNVAE
jgi:hypothetical protein